MEMSDWELDPRLCARPEGRNANVCVAEGCFNAECASNPAWKPCKGCCDSCKGMGGGGPASGPETNGLCWDCRGTGHQRH